ncbi:hypothetical protein [Sulfurimonas xiamenensis]|nr:hypothetical protein [Sulfurimonas xiamenensis]
MQTCLEWNVCVEGWLCEANSQSLSSLMVQTMFRFYDKWLMWVGESLE